jgi:two-component system, cell cycle response regulator
MRILIADDSNVSRHLLESIVRKWGYEVITTADGTQAWEELRKPDAPRLAVLDWMMPGMTGPEVCRMVREKGSDPYTYILLLTSRTQKEDVIEGMNSGADDYVVKPFDQQELNVRLRAGRRIVDLQDQLLRAQEALRYQATHDALTGVFNRGRITELIEAAAVRTETVSVIMLDLDRFKQVNDTYGHAAGDAVLVTAMERLGAALCEGESIGRYGGEEFVVLTGRGASESVALAEELRTRIAEKPIEFGGNTLVVTASFGVAVREAGKAGSAGDLLREADDALYQAKREGRNRVVTGRG